MFNRDVELETKMKLQEEGTKKWNRIFNKYKKDLETFVQRKDMAIPELSTKNLLNNKTIYLDEVEKIIDEICTTNLFLDKCIINFEVDLFEGDNPRIIKDKKDILMIKDNNVIAFYSRKYNFTCMLDIETKVVYNFGTNLQGMGALIDYIFVYAVRYILEATRIVNKDKKNIYISRREKVKVNKNKTKFKPVYEINMENYKRYIYESNDNLPKRKYDRHTEHWGVRGHWRTYKSGKRIWIEPGTRGDKTKKLNQQIYV